MLTSEKREVPLHQLRDGAEYPLGNINMRHGADPADLGPLRSSLRVHGQFQNMVGSTYDGSDEVYLIIGNRRRMAAQMNQDEDPVLSLNNMDVRVYENLTVEQAIEIGLAEKLTELPPHEVDQFEAFAALGDQDPAVIADHFHCTERLVKQRMKLGRLSAKVRNAWREGLINRQTAEAFTMGKDHKTQDKVFEKLKRTHSLFAHAVRGALLGDQQNVPRLLRFASAEFGEAGGEVITDLFEDDHGVTDPALLKQVADTKLEAHVAAMKECGFSWSALAADLPAEWEGWPRLKIKAAVPREDMVADLKQLDEIIVADESTDEERRAARVRRKRLEDFLLLKGISEKKLAETGAVILGIDNDGGLQIVYGVTRPAKEARVLEDKTSSGDAPSKNPPVIAGKGAEPESPPRLTIKAQSQRAVELTDAAAQVLAKNPKLALIVLLAGFADRGSYGAIRVSVSGSGANALQLMESDDIATNIKRLKAMKPAVLDKLFAQVAAASLVFNAHSAEHPAIEDKGTAAILGLLPPADLQKALVGRFDAEDYFGKSLPPALAMDAIRENCGAIIASEQEGQSATDLRAFALANLKDDWLPPALRGPGYAGPGAQKAKAPAKAAKPKKKAARK